MTKKESIASIQTRF